MVRACRYRGVNRLGSYIILEKLATNQINGLSIQLSGSRSSWRLHYHREVGNQSDKWFEHTVVGESIVFEVSLS